MKKKFLSYNKIISFIIIFSYVEPLLFKENGYENIDKFYSILKIFSFFILLLLNLKNLKNKKIKFHKSLLYIFIFEILIGFSTLINNGDIIKYCGPAINVLGLSLVTYYYYPKLKITFVKQFIIILFIYLFINDISVLLYPNGIIKNSAWTPVYFLGIDNRFIFFYLPLMFFVSIYSIEKYNKLSFLWYLTAFLVVFPLVLLWSVGAMIGICIFIFIILFFINKDKITKINFKNMFNVIILLNILLIFFNILGNFSHILVDVFHKDVTLSGRTFLWEEALILIKNNPIFGIGVQSNTYLSEYFYGGVTHPHNLFLSYLLEGGIVSIVIYLLFVFEFSKGTTKIINNKIKFNINIVIFIVYILSLVDTLTIGLMFVIFIIGILYNEVNENEKNRDFNIT